MHINYFTYFYTHYYPRGKMRFEMNKVDQIAAAATQRVSLVSHHVIYL